MLSRSQHPAHEQSRRCTSPPLATSMVALAAVALAASWPAGPISISTAEAKTPGKTYCFYRVCHRVMTLDETRRAVGKRMVLHASHYDDPKKDRFNPSNLTSSGEWFRAGSPDNAASPKLPNGTVILAWNPVTRQSAVLRINNAGPYWGSRTLDVSRAAAERLGIARQGVARLHVEVVRAPTKADVTYRKGRRYAAVPGPIGTHATFEMALAATNQLMRIPAPSTSTLIASLPARTSPERETETREGPIPATSDHTPLAPAMPAAVAAVSALTEAAAASKPTPDLNAAVALASPQASSRDESAAATQATPPVEAARISAPDTAGAIAPKAPTIRAKARKTAKPRKTIAAASSARVVSTAKLQKPTHAAEKIAAKAVKKTRVAQLARPDMDTPAQPRRVRIRTGVVELAGTDAAQQRSRAYASRRTIVAAADLDDDDDRKPIVRRAVAPQRRAVNSNTSPRLPAGCRDGSASCEFTTSPNGNVTSVRSWRVSSSKRQ